MSKETEIKKIDDSKKKNVKIGPKKYEIPEEWEKGVIGDNTYLKARIGWQNLTSDEYRDEGEYYLVTGTEFDEGEVSWDDCVYVSKERYERDPNIQLKKNDVLVTKDGSIGKTAYVSDLPGPATLNTGVFVLRPLENAYQPKYLYYLLNSVYFEDFIDTITKGSTISHLYQKDFVNFEFPIPPRDEQEAIVNILDYVNKELGHTRKVIEETYSLKRGMTQDLMRDGVNKTEKKKADLGPRKYEIPEHWETSTLGEEAEIVSGSTPKKSEGKYWGGDITWITPTDITDNDSKYISSSAEKITNEGLESCSTNMIEPGAVLMTSRATIGEASINTEKVCTNQGFKSIVCGENLHNEFLYYYLPLLKDYLTEIGSGSTFPELNKSDTKNIKIPLPPIDEQREIAERLSVVDEKIRQEEEYKEKLEELKTGLMQDLLTGKKRVEA